MECLVNFVVKHKNQETKQLRGLIFLNDQQRPGDEQLLQMFRDMKFDLVVADRDTLLFEPVDPSSDYISIRIVELDMGEDRYTEDRDLKTILSNFL
ncbi:hypothetical protein J2T13_001510 [Paenibacillus sp. DS2015]|uniref:hypothetical protein n=1 Tax=Paenibacillus sp. DS2015 TaxID=3373917 RepID=UPI003D1B3C8B